MSKRKMVEARYIGGTRLLDNKMQEVWRLWVNQNLKIGQDNLSKIKELWTQNYLVLCIPKSEAANLLDRYGA